MAFVDLPCVRLYLAPLSYDSCYSDPPARPAGSPCLLGSSLQPLWLPPPCGLHRHPLRCSRSQVLIWVIASETVLSAAYVDSSQGCAWLPLTPYIGPAATSPVSGPCLFTWPQAHRINYLLPCNQL